VPKDRPGDVTLVEQQLSPISAQLIMLDSNVATAHWVPSQPGTGELEYELPLGQQKSEWAQANTAVIAMAWQCISRTMAQGPTISNGLQTDSQIVTAWLANNIFEPENQDETLMVKLPVTMDEAKAAYYRITTCDY
jgi:hypothetical protein